MARVLRALDSSDSTQDKDTVEYLPDHLLATLPKRRCKHMIPNPSAWEVVQAVYDSITKIDRRHAMAEFEYSVGRELLQQPGDILIEWAIDADELRQLHE